VTLRFTGPAWGLLVLSPLFVAASTFLTNERWPLGVVLLVLQA
jgi:hypothetical protein